MKNILDILKKNIAIVICLVVAAVAIVADFIPLGGFRDELRTEATQRASMYGSIDELLNKKRTLPNLDPAAAEPKALEGFPTAPVIESAKAVTEKFTSIASNLHDAAAKLNEKAPLKPGTLPKPDFVQANAFMQEYRNVVDFTTPRGRAASLPVRIMNAGFAPTPADLTAASDETKARITQTMAIYADGQIRNQEQVTASIQAEEATLLDRIVRQVAEKCSVYIDEGTMDVQAQLRNASTAPEPLVLFWAQVGLWAQEELFRAIADVNSGAKNVSQSPIKRLFKVSVGTSFVGVGGPGADANTPAAPPPTDPSAPLTPNYAKSPTGRTSNGLFDVVHMSVVMDVEAGKLPTVLDQLGRGRLLTVLQVRRVEPVDSAAALNHGYFYGDAPCVRVELDFEWLMLRKWSEQYMPDSIRTALGITATTGAPPPG